MLSLIAAISSSAYNFVFGEKKPDDEEENEITILERALEVRNEALPEEMPIDEECCFYAEGRITTISEDYVIINNELYCPSQNVPSDLNLGAKVRYLAYQSDEEKEVKVSRIENVIDDWQIDEASTSEPSESVQNCNRVNRQKMMRKVLVEVVSKREGRLVYAGDLTIDLNTVASDFVPLVGDSVKVTALVAVDPNEPDLAGEVVTVRRIEPLLSKQISGTVTNFDPNNKTGNINMRIFFHRSSIGIGYVPCVGDTVVCDCIESVHQSYKWRALLIFPLHKVKKSEVSNITKHGVQLPANMNELEKNKNGVEVDNGLEMRLEMMQEKELKIAVGNKGCVVRVIKQCSLSADQNQSQLRLLRPRENDQVNLKGGEVINYVFKVKGRFVGKSTELVQFHFETFQIARLVTINVRPKEVVRTTNLSGCSFNRNVQVREWDYDQHSRVRGVTPFPKAHFMVANGRFEVNKNMEKLVVKIANSKMSTREAHNELLAEFPEFGDTLNFATYVKNFQNLLYLEEIAMRIGIQMYAMESVILNRAGEYLTMEVPGLAEKRPSLIVGDQVICEYKYPKSHRNEKFEGYIHKIYNTQIFLKFGSSFHENYNREDCRASFKASPIVLHRSHRAIKAVYGNLGINFLFPARVVEKEPQYELEELEPQDNIIKSEESIQNDKCVVRLAELLKEIEDLKDEEKVKRCKDALRTRKLKWYNEKLNKYQKEAVKNILTGVARPLPYIIFGPPGTGKTITIVETILQIYTLITDSRLLIATPSNSSANLIAEKLLDYDVLKPGDMVRLVAHYYMTSDSIPDCLRPYCAVADLTSANSNGARFEYNYCNDMQKKSLNLSQLGRHRIIVGTCASLGILHNMGFKKGQFTHVLVDEAGQAPEPECMIPLSYLDLETGQAILAGDPLQLGPVVISKLAAHFGYSQSYLVRLLQLFPYQRDTVGFKHGYDPRLVTKLLINYRSLPEMLQLPNDMFYDSELIPFIQYQGSREAMLLERMRDDLPKRRGPAPAVVFHGVNGVNRQDDDSPSWYNLEEATQVYLYFLRLCEKGFTADDIGIITPYKKQVTEIRNLLCEVGVDIPKVGTVEEFQGQERNVIIVSTVRSMSNLVAQDVKFTLGFVSAPQRLNVAITRARSLLIIIGNPGLLSQDPYWKYVLDYCTKRTCYTGCNWNPVLQNSSAST